MNNIKICWPSSYLCQSFAVNQSRKKKVRMNVGSSASGIIVNFDFCFAAQQATISHLLLTSSLFSFLTTSCCFKCSVNSKYGNLSVSRSGILLKNSSIFRKATPPPLPPSAPTQLAQLPLLLLYLDLICDSFGLLLILFKLLLLLLLLLLYSIPLNEEKCQCVANRSLMNFNKYDIRENGRTQFVPFTQYRIAVDILVG
uniref:Uncharacterized protein n=1 Tax=Glossina austeni TaxID=7395 RepID=A0A1A9UN02_GLOAU